MRMDSSEKAISSLIRDMQDEQQGVDLAAERPRNWKNDLHTVLIVSLHRFGYIGHLADWSLLLTSCLIF